MQIEAQVDDFVGNLQRLIYETAVEAVQRATAAKSQARVLAPAVFVIILLTIFFSERVGNNLDLLLRL